VLGLLDLRLGAGAALVPDEDTGLAWQLRLGLPLPLGRKVQPELEIRLDRAYLDGDRDLLGIGAGVGLRF
jgi:hypothetical protein